MDWVGSTNIWFHLLQAGKKKEDKQWPVKETDDLIFDCTIKSKSQQRAY